MSLATTRTAIQAAINIAGLTVYDRVIGNPVPPCAVVSWPETFDPHAAFGDNANYVIPVIVMVPYQTEDADNALMAYLTTSGATSVVAAIEAGSNAWQVTTVHDFGPMVTGDQGQIALACIIDVDVMA